MCISGVSSCLWHIFLSSIFIRYLTKENSTSSIYICFTLQYINGVERVLYRFKIFSILLHFTEINLERVYFTPINCILLSSGLTIQYNAVFLTLMYIYFLNQSINKFLQNISIKINCRYIKNRWQYTQKVNINYTEQNEKCTYYLRIDF